MKKLIRIYAVFIAIILITGNTIDVMASTNDDRSKKEYTTDKSGTIASIKNTSGVDLPTQVCNDKKMKRMILPKDIRQLLSEDYYETDPSLMQYYTSITPNCPNLSSVSVDKKNKYFTSIDGVLYNKEKTELYYCPPGKTGELKVPEGVKTIGFMAFQECSKLTSIILPSTLKNIQEGAFGGNTNLKELKVSDENTFFKSVSNVLFREDGEELVAYAGGNTDKTYTIPEGVKAISAAAFMGCINIQELIAHENLITVGNEAFRNCTAIKKVHFENGLHELYAGAFYNCSKLEDLNLPEGTRDVNEKALFGCDNLLNIVIPSSIQSFVCDITNVPKRTIKIYNPYFGYFNHNEIAKDIKFYCYRNSNTSKILIEEGFPVNYFDENYAPDTTTLNSSNNAVKGTGKPDTSWYNWSSPTYEISNPDQLAGLAQLARQEAELYKKTIVLKNDLDLSCYPNWLPIGGAITKECIFPFSGNFDGNGHVIYNLRINRTDSIYQGLFGTNLFDIHDLNIKDAVVIGGDYVGILSGANHGTIRNCNISGTLYGCEEIGGIAGISEDIDNCTVSANINGKTFIGGITGVNMNRISNCYTDGKINGNNIVGGISGNMIGGTIDNCKNRMLVTGDSEVGGILGEINSDSIVSNSINNYDVNGVDRVGGIIGDYGFGGTTTNCTNNGKVRGSYYVGGIAGYLSVGQIDHCFNKEKVSGISGVGGILGNLGYVYPEYKRVIECVNTAKVEGMRYTNTHIGKDVLARGLTELTGD